MKRLRKTPAEIAETLSMPLSTVSAVLTRIGLGRLSRLEPPNRYSVASGRARPHRREEARPDQRRRGQALRRRRRATRLHYRRVPNAAGVRRLTVGGEYAHVSTMPLASARAMCSRTRKQRRRIRQPALRNSLTSQPPARTRRAHHLAAAGCSESCATPRLRITMRREAARRDRGGRASVTRNEGVRGSNPRVGFVDFQVFSDFRGIGQRRSSV